MESKYESRITSHEPSPLIKGLGESRIRAGSALILVVVLTSLLAIVGVMFVMVARVDRIATSAISENKTLDYAVEAVIARISQELVLDVPGVAGQEYYDYPDAKNAWLASLEPYEYSLNNYRWRQISDVTGYIEQELGGPTAREGIVAEIVEDHEEIELDSSGDIESSPEQLADADGDGVADSKWIELEGINSSKGKTIYAAIRVIDNGAMLNVNTAYQFNPASPGTDGEYIDGSDQMQINLLALAQRNIASDAEDLDNLDEARFGSEPRDMDNYLRDVVWRYYQPAEDTAYTPFDLSDELELRNRYTLNREDIDSRIEEVWNSAFQSGPVGSPYLSVPVSSSSSTIGVWGDEVYYDYDVNDPNIEDDYSYRHVGTTYNMDRIINPYGGKMVNVNRDGVGLIYSAIKLALFTADPNFKDIDEIAAQTAVNLIDFRDENSDVTPLPDVNGITYYGFERPCVYISEVVHKFEIPPAPGGPIGPGGEPVIYRSYAIELYKPYEEDSDPSGWRLVISGPPPPGGPIGAPIGRFTKGECDIDWSSGEQFHVMLKEDFGAPLTPFIDDSNAGVQDCDDLVFSDDDLIELRRRVDEVRDIWVTVDSIEVTGWLVPDSPVVGGTRSFERDINRHKCIRRLWGSNDIEEDLTLGSDNGYSGGGSVIQAHPAYRDFTNVGEIGMVFRKGAYYIDPADRPDTIGYSTNTDDEAEVRVNLADPNYHNIFKYLTVWPPSEYVSDHNEVRIKGRININTAPWYVIAQLPWMRPEIARAIVAYRDKAVIPDQNNINYTNRQDATGIDGIREEAGFASIGELATVINDPCDPNNDPDYSMHYYALDSDDLAGFPDLTPGGSTADGAEDDFEERDVIFARLSNLVTVRSDVFTAYMLVRIGADGPQKRIMAILDRSNVYTDDGRVQIVALHAVADPR